MSQVTRLCLLCANNHVERLGELDHAQAPGKVITTNVLLALSRGELVYYPAMLRMLAWTLAIAVAACAAEGGDSRDVPLEAGHGSNRICNPGDLRLCSGTNGCNGARVCLSSGLAYDACSCVASGSPSAASSPTSNSPRKQQLTPAAGSASAAPSPSGNAGMEGPATQNPSVDFRKQFYDAPKPPECALDDDCAGGCCVQIGTSYRQCETGTACTLHWITPAPSTIPRWQQRDIAGYSGSYEADVVHSRIDELIQSGDDVVYKLDNGQYWVNHFATSHSGVSAGDECWVVPGRDLYHLFIGQSRDSIGVQQVPIVLDTQVLSATRALESHGVYELEGAGYWVVFSESKVPTRRALLATPNNVDFWLFTDGRSEDHVDPAEVRSDSSVTTVSPDGVRLADGSAWGYLGTSTLVQPVIGDHAIVYQQALVDDEDPDMPIFDNVWIEGRTEGQLLLVLPAR